MIFYIILVTFYIFQYALCRECKVLALSGGGDKGSYEAGVIYGLTQNGKLDEFEWDIVSGISVGSLNAVASLYFRIGEESKWGEFLKNSWLNLRKDKVYKHWFGGYIEGLLRRRGLFNTSPLKTFLEESVKNLKPYDRRISVSAADVTDGKLYTWTEKYSKSDLIQSVMASSAIPAIFPSIYINGTEYVDGALAISVDIVNAALRCINDGITDNMNEIVIDVIGCSPINKEPIDTTKDKTMMILYRALKASGLSGNIKLINEALDNFPKVVFRNIIFPSKRLEGNSIDFTPESIKNNFYTGVGDAMDWILEREDIYNKIKDELAYPEKSTKEKKLIRLVFEYKLKQIEKQMEQKSKYKSVKNTDLSIDENSYVSNLENLFRNSNEDIVDSDSLNDQLVEKMTVAPDSINQDYEILI